MNSTAISSFIRPIQTSRLANLPTEILIEIEKKLRENCDEAFERQKEMIKFSSLCFSTRETSTRWKEVAVHDEKLGELAKLLKEIGAGPKIESITISEGLPWKYHKSPPSIEFGQLMRLCTKLSGLHLWNSTSTFGKAAEIGVNELVNNNIELFSLTLYQLQNLQVFHPLLGRTYPSHLLMEYPPDHTFSPVPTVQFISVDLRSFDGIELSNLSNLLSPSAGFIQSLSVENLMLYWKAEEEQEIAITLFEALGQSLTQLTIWTPEHYSRLQNSREIQLVLPLLKKLEHFVLAIDYSFDSDIFKDLSDSIYLRTLSIVCSPMWTDNFGVNHRADLLNGQMIDRMEELKEAAKVGKLELIFPSEWDEIRRHLEEQERNRFAEIENESD